MKNNSSLLGFDSLTDLFHTMFGLKAKYWIGMISIIGGLSSIITEYVYDSAESVYFMVILLFVDAFTAIIRSIKEKNFSSKRLPRVLVLLLGYMGFLAISWQMKKHVPMYFFIPGIIYTGFVTVLFVSIAENLMLIGAIPKSIYFELKQRLHLKDIFNKKKEKDDDQDNLGI